VFGKLSVHKIVLAPAAAQRYPYYGVIYVDRRDNLPISTQTGGQLLFLNVWSVQASTHSNPLGLEFLVDRHKPDAMQTSFGLQHAEWVSTPSTEALQGT